jgi:hypothetical protein
MAGIELEVVMLLKSADGKDVTIPIADATERVAGALDMLLSNGGYDGGHHKMWTIDQAIRILAGQHYGDVIKWYEEDGQYTWDTGIAP